MFDSAMPSLNYFYDNFAVILLIFARVAGMIFLIPIFSGRNVPVSTKIGFSFIVALLIFSTGVVKIGVYDDSAVGYVFLMAKEVITGLILSFIVFLFFSIFYFAGQLIDYQIGFSMLSVMDPLSQIQVAISGNLIYYTMAVLFICTGALNAVLLALFSSYTQVPIGSITLVGNAGMATYFTELTGNYLMVGFQIAAPIVGTILIVDVALGVLVKAVPQMNVFVVGMPIKLLIGLIVLYIISPYYISVFNTVYAYMAKAIQEVMAGMVMK